MTSACVSASPRRGTRRGAGESPLETAQIVGAQDAIDGFSPTRNFPTLAKPCPEAKRQGHRRGLDSRGLDAEKSRELRVLLVEDRRSAPPNLLPPPKRLESDRVMMPDVGLGTIDDDVSDSS